MPESPCITRRTHAARNLLTCPLHFYPDRPAEHRLRHIQGGQVSWAQEEAQPARTFVCPHCEQPALGHVRGRAISGYGWNEDLEEFTEETEEYALLQCGTCRRVSVQLREGIGEYFDPDDDPLIVFPAGRQLSLEVPRPLRLEFEEAQRCFAAKAYKATVVMVRRVLEGTCKENNVQERTLIKSLDKLKADGLLDATIAEWADTLRILGNEGAHYTGKQVPRDDAEDALAFAEALLDHIYVLQKRFEKLKERRANKKSSKEPVKLPLAGSEEAYRRMQANIKKPRTNRNPTPDP
jgi:hypothetical protein